MPALTHTTKRTTYWSVYLGPLDFLNPDNTYAFPSEDGAQFFAKSQSGPRRLARVYAPDGTLLAEYGKGSTTLKASTQLALDIAAPSTKRKMTVKKTPDAAPPKQLRRLRPLSK
jgi:hypothetical protein